MKIIILMFCCAVANAYSCVDVKKDGTYTIDHQGSVRSTRTK